MPGLKIVRELFWEPGGALLDEWFGSLSQLAHLGATDELLQSCNLRPDLVLFADKVMDTLGQLLLVREKKISGT